MTRLLTIAALALTLAFAFASCTRVETQESVSEDAPVTDVALASYTVECGCRIDDVGRCGNYIEIDDQFVEIGNGSDLGLGVMEWCGKGEQTCDAEGTLADGKFVAKSFEVKE